MCRWLAILFMVFMPLQLGWAAVSGYCQHETGAAANHLGHHEHQHHGDEPDPGSKPATDLDCGFCQAASIAALPSSTISPTLAVPPPSVAPQLQQQIRSAPSREPERPKWIRPA